MNFMEKLNSKFIKYPMMIIVLISGALHLYCYSIVRNLVTFNVYDLFNSSPFFDFSISTDCGNKSNIIFHRWGGFSTYRRSKRIILNETDITKINGYYFCYKHISYKDLLYNGQIIKNGTECPKEYNKNCGRIDTLNQELCIKENEKCPLYEIGIGIPPNFDNYTYNNSSNIYYNNHNYNDQNKTIIGRAILNDGQPCYNSSEKLWRSFYYTEADNTHLNCTLSIFNKNSDNRFTEKGNITYKKLYEDNLDEKLRKRIIENMEGNESVYLYKREFFGLDKKCSEKYYLNDIIKSYQDIQLRVVLCEFLGGIAIMGIVFAFMFIEMLMCILSKNERPEERNLPQFFLCIYITSFVFFSTTLVFYTIGFIRIKQNNYLNFNCSDKITNEIIRKGQEIDNIKLELKCNYIDFYSDLSVIITIIIIFIICVIWHIKDKKSKTPGEELNDGNTPCENSENETPCENDKLNGNDTPIERNWFDTPGGYNKNEDKSEDGVKVPLNSCYTKKNPIN